MRGSMAAESSAHPAIEIDPIGITIPAAGESVSDAHLTKRIRVSEGALQAAARLKVLLPREERIAAISGLTMTDDASSLLAQLGTALASIDPSSVLIVDANFERPRVHTLLGLSQSPGLLDVLEGRCSVDGVIRESAVSNLRVVTLGASRSPLALLINTPRAEQVFAEMRKRFGYTLLDVGVALAAPESILLTSISDGVVLAVTVGKHRQHELAQFREGLERLKLRLIGVVLTQHP
jgi:succinoglycan biosynthesis transport protein ExoP